MKKFMTRMLLAAAALVGAAQAEAQSGLRLGVPGYGGNGCPAGSASITLSPDESQLSILFDQYVVEAGGMTGKRLDRKSCNIAIPVTVPNGYSISIFQVDYRGFNSLPRGARATFNAEYFFAGSQGLRSYRTFMGHQDQDYLITDMFGVAAMVWSSCGANTNLRVNSSMTVQSNPRMEQALSTVDSADISNGIIYHIQWRRCP